MPPKPKDPIFDTEPKTGTADQAQTGPAPTTPPPATGADTLAADAGGAGDPVDPDVRFTITFIVQGPVAGRWRAGRHFTAEPTSIPAGDLTFDQMAALRADPLLMIKVVEAPY